MVAEAPAAATADVLDHESEDELLDAGEDAGPDGYVGGHGALREGARGRGEWLKSLGLGPRALAGKIITVGGYKGGIGKTTIAYELAYLLDAILVDFDWNKGGATRSGWGYREENRKGAPLLEALLNKRTPRPLSGGIWKPDLVPSHSDLHENEPAADDTAVAIERWAREWATTYGRPVVVDTHPGSGPSTLGALACADVAVVPCVFAENEVEATCEMMEDLKAYRLLIVPYKVKGSEPARYRQRILSTLKSTGVHLGPPVGRYEWLERRALKIAVSADRPVAIRARPLVEELQSVARAVVKYVYAAA